MNLKNLQITKRYVIVFCLISALIASFFTYSFASTPSVTFTISSGQYPGAPSYTIYNVGSNYYAKDQNGLNEYVDTNQTYVCDLCADALSSGTIFLVELEWPIAVTVPENVMVIEQYDGVQKKYINVADSQGSPYTVSTDGTYYYCQDSALSYINSFTSTVFSTLINDNVLDNCLSGDTIRLTNSNYTVTAAITDQSKNDITFDGGNSWLVLGDGNEAHVISLTSVSGWKIKNLKIDGNNDGQSLLGDGIRLDTVSDSYCTDNYITATELYGIRGSTLTNCVISHNLIENTNHTGIGFDTTCENNTISENIVKGSVSQHGILLYTNCHHNKVINNQASNNNWKGIALALADDNLIANNHCYNNVEQGITVDEGSDRNTVTNNHANFNGADGIAVTLAGGTSLYNKVEANYCYYNTVSGIYIDQSNTAVLNNFCKGNGAHGIDIYDASACENVTVRGNILTNNGRLEAGSWTQLGIKLNGCFYCLITENTCIDDQGSATQVIGIGEYGTSDYNIIKNNEISGSSTTIQVSGVHTQVFFNPSYNPVGVISNPIVTGETTLRDSGGNDTIANATTYTNWQSPKTIYMQDADTFDVYVEGQLVADDVNYYVITLQPSDTFKIEWVSALTTLKFIGE